MQTALLFSIFSLVWLCCSYVAEAAAASESCVDLIGKGMKCEMLPMICSSRIARLVCKRFCKFCEPLSSTTVATTDPSPTQPPEQAGCGDHLVGGMLTCPSIPGVCDDDYGRLFCRRSCGFCPSTAAAATARCEDNMGNGLNCVELAQICAHRYGAIVCPKSCGVCSPDPNAVTSAPDTSSAPLGSCTDKVVRGVTCADLQNVCTDTYGQIICRRYCGFCGSTTVSTTDHHSTLGLQNSTITSGSGASISTPLAATDISTSGLPFPPSTAVVVNFSITATNIASASTPQINVGSGSTQLTGTGVGSGSTLAPDVGSGSTQAAGVGSGSTVATGVGSGSTLATGVGSGSTVATGVGSGSTLAAGVGSGSTVATGVGSGSTLATNITFSLTPLTNNNTSGSSASSSPSPSTVITFHPPTMPAVATSDVSSAFSTTGPRPNTLTSSPLSSSSSEKTTLSTPSTSQALHWSKCMDHIGRGRQCSSYAGFCTDTYATMLCPKFCGFCVPLWETGTFAPDTATSPTSDSCVDRVTNGLTCQDLPLPGLCDNDYGKLICPQTCNTCSTGTVSATPSTSPAPTMLTMPTTMTSPRSDLVSLSSLMMSTVTPTQSTQRHDGCIDNVGLGMSCDGACNDPLAPILCRKTCGFCDCQDSITGMTCKDLVLKYDRDPCLDPLGHQVCARFCGFC